MPLRGGSKRESGEPTNEPIKSLRQPYADGVHKGKSLWGQMVQMVLETAQEERRKSSTQEAQGQKTYKDGGISRVPDKPGTPPRI